MRVFTYTLNSGSLTISQTDGVMFLSVQCATSSSCTVLGNLPFKNLTPTTVTLSAGQGINMSALTPVSTLDGITITQTSGSVDILIGF